MNKSLCRVSATVCSMNRSLSRVSAIAKVCSRWRASSHSTITEDRDCVRIDQRLDSIDSIDQLMLYLIDLSYLVHRLIIVLVQ